MPEAEQNVLTAAVTGHRPDKLYGYDLKNQKYYMLRRLLAACIEKYKARAVWTGMALGADTIMALAALDLKKSGYNVRLKAAVPFPGQESRWPQASQDLYHAILSKCDTKTIVTNGPYSPKAMQDRNIYMADRADYIIAVWNGSGGGTANCVRYALAQDVPVLRVDPGLTTMPRWQNRPEHFIPEIRQKRRHL